MVIERNVRCIECGYNLRGLAEEGTCPECNTLVASTLRRPVRRKLWVWIIGSLFVLFHSGIVTVPLLIYGGALKYQWYAVAVYDFPLAVLWNLIVGRPVVNSAMSMPREVLIAYFSIGGTILYAAVGGLVGRVIDWLRFQYHLSVSLSEPDSTAK